MKKERTFWYTVTFYCLGASILLPWNFFITADSYWQYKLRNTTLGEEGWDLPGTPLTPLQIAFTPTLSLVSNVFCSAFFYVNIAIVKRVNEVIRVMGSLIVSLSTMLIITLLTFINSDEWQEEFFSFTMVLIAILNVTVAILQSSLYGMAAMFPESYTSALVSGQAIAGVFSSLARIVSLAIGNQSPIKSGIIFFFIADIGLLVTVISFYRLVTTDFYRRYISPTVLPPIDDSGRSSRRESSKGSFTPGALSSIPEDRAITNAIESYEHFSMKEPSIKKDFVIEEETNVDEIFVKGDNDPKESFGGWEKTEDNESTFRSKETIIMDKKEASITKEVLTEDSTILSTIPRTSGEDLANRDDLTKCEVFNDDDELNKEMSKNENNLIKEVSKNKENFIKEVSTNEADLITEVSKNEDLIEEVSKNEDDLSKEVSKNEDDLTKEDLENEEDLSKEVSKNEDDLIKKVLKNEYEISKEASRNEDLSEEVSKNEDDLSKEVSKDEHTLIEEVSKNEKLNEEVSKSGNDLSKEASRNEEDLSGEVSQNENDLNEVTSGNEGDLESNLNEEVARNKEAIHHENENNKNENFVNSGNKVSRSEDRSSDTENSSEESSTGEATTDTEVCIKHTCNSTTASIDTLASNTDINSFSTDKTEPVSNIDFEGGKEAQIMKQSKGSSASCSEDKEGLTWALIWKIFLKIWPLAINVGLIYMTTLIVYPSVTVYVTSSLPSSDWTDIYFQPTVTFLLFNIIDVIGRETPRVLQWPGDKGPLLYVLSAARVLLIPLLLLCHGDKKTFPTSFQDDSFYIAFIVLFAFTSGYFSTLSIIYYPSLVSEEERELAGNIMASFLGVGLVIGSAMSPLLVLLWGPGGA
ncbi:uncharacterized protein LOC143039991 [Oratosquilla oratoria]|uniref:uncharacterized protein LOC143039991 n=1 Tax=Oratosquilla oratoria TaxID=337810 RepID=UPI003F75EF85